MRRAGLKLSRLLLLVAALLSSATVAHAQEPPPRIPFFVFDAHGTLPRFPSAQTLADSRGLTLAELPGTGFGVQLGLHLYPLRWRGVTFGIGAEVAGTRARQEASAVNPGLRATEEKFLTAAPQLSFNFGTGSGWSYLSGGIGLSQWSLVPIGEEPLPPDTERIKTINYGGGARWFAKPHLAFSFDVRFYAINPGSPYATFPGTPRTTLMVIGAGVSVK